MNKELELKVIAWLRLNNITQYELARRLGISGAYLSDILKGKRSGEKQIPKIKKIIEFN